MAILIDCKCGRQLRAQDNQAGRLVKCPACGREMRVPKEAEKELEQTVREVPPPSRRRRDDDLDEEPEPRRPARRRDEDLDEEEEPRRPARRRREATETSGKSLASLICGVISFCVPVVMPAIAFVLGLLGVRDVNASRGRLGGKGMATVGIILAIVATGLHLVGGLIVFGAFKGVGKIRDSASEMQSRNNLKQIGIAMLNYHDTHGTFPPAAIRSKQDGRPLLSWRVALLPYLEQDALYQQFNLDEPWDSPANKALLARMPRIYAPPAPREDRCPPDHTFYRVFVGPGTAFENPQGHKLTDIQDGTSNTWGVVEAGDAVPWTKPDELTYSPTAPLPRLGGIFDGDFNACTLDGAVQHYKKDEYTESELRGFITRNGGEVNLWK